MRDDIEQLVDSTLINDHRGRLRSLRLENPFGEITLAGVISVEVDVLDEVGIFIDMLGFDATELALINSRLVRFFPNMDMRVIVMARHVRQVVIERDVSMLQRVEFDRELYIPLEFNHVRSARRCLEFVDAEPSVDRHYLVEPSSHPNRLVPVNGDIEPEP